MSEDLAYSANPPAYLTLSYRWGEKPQKLASTQVLKHPGISQWFEAERSSKNIPRPSLPLAAILHTILLD
jgi:hypothetical protein